MPTPTEHDANRLVARDSSAATGERIDVIDPATGETVGHIDAATIEEVQATVGTTRDATTAWSRTPAAERARLLHRAADRLRERRQEIAELQTREGGKPLADSLGGVDAGIGAIEQYAELGPLHRGRSLHGSWDATDLMVPVPRGVAAVIVPWNDPVAVTAGLVAANLAVGNTVVLKPSEKTPLCSLALMACFDHLPTGVANTVVGGPISGAALVEADVDLVLHMGSVTTGRAIAVRCAERQVKAVLELGGKDALIVDEGVDPGWAAEQAATGAFANAGQLCTSVERIYVHRNVSEPFVAALVEQAEQLGMGPGLDPQTEMGPLIDDRQRRLVHGHVTEAVAAGGRLLTGGAVPDGAGTFYPPTVVVDVPDGASLVTEETFGPVAAVVVVESWQEALARASASPYGLGAVVLTPSQAHAQEAWTTLPVGTVKVNAVFGGAPGGAAEPHGISGSGFGFGPELLDELTRTRVVHLEPAPPVTR